MKKKIFVSLVSVPILLFIYLFSPDFTEHDNLYERACGVIRYMDILEKKHDDKNRKINIKDPWENPYIIDRKGKSYKIYSLGGDGKIGGSGIDKDIYLSDCLKLSNNQD